MSAQPPEPSTALAQLRALVKSPPAPARVTDFPPIRSGVIDLMMEGRRKNIINLVLQAELPNALARGEADTAGEASITSVVAFALAKTVGEFKEFNAYRRGRSQLVVFDDVDLCFTVEREVDGAILPILFVVRSANRKTAVDIHRELQAAKVAPVGVTGPMTALEKRFLLMPRVVRSIVWFLIRRNPYLFKRLFGTVGVTSMGMFATGAAVVQPITPMTLTLSIGAIEKKIVMQDGAATERAFIHLNIGADHDIIDGAPLMRFAEALRARLQAGNSGE